MNFKILPRFLNSTEFSLLAKRHRDGFMRNRQAKVSHRLLSALRSDLKKAS
jgi:hypothetical protein